MVKEAARNNLGGEDSSTFFNHPAITRMTAFINPDCAFADRYLFKLAAHAEIITEDDTAKVKAPAITAMVIMLAEHGPLSLVESLSKETRQVASDWIEAHCKVVEKKP